MDRCKDLLNRVEDCMRRITCSPGQDEALIVRAVEYHLGAGGARIRALVCIDAAYQLGLHDATAVVLATACELLHNASLVQDDVFDRESMRRGLESVWRRFGETVALCAGDLMLAGAYAILAELADTTLVAPSIQLTFRHTRSVIVGQGTEKNAVPISLSGYEAVAIAKSASLLMLPLHLPLLVSGHSRFLPLAQRVAESFAVAYQIADDLDDYLQDQQVGAVNVLSVVLCQGTVTLDQARTIAIERAIELLHRCIEDAAQLPRNCSAVMVSHAKTMLTKLETKATSQLVPIESMQYVG